MIREEYIFVKCLCQYIYRTVAIFLSCDRVFCMVVACNIFLEKVKKKLKKGLTRMGIPDLMQHRGVRDDLAIVVQSNRRGHNSRLGGKGKVRKQDGGKKSYLE